MEQFPQSNENNESALPILSLDLSGPDGNVFAVISHARSLLQGDELEAFGREIQAATTPGAGKRYEDILAIVNSHIELMDTSNLYRQYGREEKITAAVARLNEQLLTLPDTVPCALEGLYPEFDNYDCDPEMYVALLENEVTHVEAEIGRSDESNREPLETLKGMLLACVAAFRRVGVV